MKGKMVMKTLRFCCVLLVLLFPALSARAGGVITQSFDLHPGWNSIYLEVEPDETSIETVLAGQPVQSVWTWRDGYRKTQFVRNPDEELLSVDGWFGWFPPSGPSAALSNLYHFEANRAYLIEIASEAPPFTWTVSGMPVLRQKKWAADTLNFVGFAVDPESPPTFGEYFAPSPAHAAQKVYRMGADGRWQEITAPYSTTIQSGVGYLVYCKGASDYQGPLEIDTGSIDGLDFVEPLSGLSITIRNALDVDVDLRLGREPGAPVPLLLEIIDDQTARTSWPVLPDGYSKEVAAGKSDVLTLGVRRADLESAEAREVLSISNGKGVRILVPVHVSAATGTTTAKAASTAGRFAGLWVGTATIRKVSQAQEAGTETTPVGATFPLRFILHVDSGGQIHLLKEVLQVWKEGTTKPDPDNPGYNTTDTAGHYVLLTDDSLIDQFSGIIVRDGTPVGVRTSTVAYDFQGQMLRVLGSIGLSGDLDVTIVVPVDLPTNPFYDRYHPDHDNLDAEFLNFKAEAYEVTRKIHWHFEDTDPDGIDSPGWGSDILGGSYSEELTGLHRNPIFISGTFRMRRVSSVESLNE